jgi:hypothetical protein
MFGKELIFPSSKSKGPSVSSKDTTRTRHPAALPPTLHDEAQNRYHDDDERVPLLGQRHKQQRLDSTTSGQSPDATSWKQRFHSRRFSTIAVGVTVAADAAIATSLPLSSARPSRRACPKPPPQTSKQCSAGAPRSRHTRIKPSLCSLNLCVVHTTLTSTKALPRTAEFSRDWIDKPSGRITRKPGDVC